MLRVAITIAAGYAAGPLLGGGFELVCRRAGWPVPDGPYNTTAPPAGSSATAAHGSAGSGRQPSVLYRLLEGVGEEGRQL